MRLLLAGALLVAACASTILAPARPASACSPDEDSDPVGTSDVIVAGRITGWVRADPLGSVAPTPIRVTMTVDRVLKGDAPRTLSFIDPRSYIEFSTVQPGTPQSVWGGDCGSFGSDPTGLHVVLGLIRRDDSALSTIGPLLFSLEGTPAGVGEWHERARQRLAALGPGRLPRTGAAPAGLDPTRAFLPTAFGISTLIVAGAILVMLRRERHERDDLL